MKTALVAALLACTALTACTDDVDSTPTAAGGSSSAQEDLPTSAPTTAAPTTPAPVQSTPPSAEPPFPADTSVDTSPAAGEQLTVVAVRAARQQGYDRVVFELRGKDGAAGTPGWRVEYVDEARQDGSGEEVEVAGESVLSVVIEGSGLPFDTGQEEASQDLSPRDTARVREVDLQATYEGRFTAFVGLDRRVPFRVFRLSDPARVVVDVLHS